jgi:O-antigen ligase/polysaccharide polymerase Wzy-like membrane protein
MIRAEFPHEGRFDWLLNPATPLAIYFSLSTMLAELAPYVGIAHPAYWIFGYLGACVAWRLRERPAGIDPVDLVFLAFIAVILVSWTQTGYTGGRRTLVLITASALIPWVAARVLRAPDVGRFLEFIGSFGAFVCLLYVVAIPVFQVSDLWERVELLGGAAYGIIGPTVGLLAVMAGTYLMREHSRAVWAAMPLTVLVIVHMGGRGMYVSMIFALLFASLFIDSGWKRKLAVWGAVLVSTLVSAVVIPGARLENFLRLGFTIPAPDRAVDDTIAERVRLYGKAFELFLQHPLAGVGTGRFGLESWLHEELTTPHSTVFQVISELGLAGAVPFAALNVMLFVTALKASRATLICSVVASAWIYFAVFDQISANYLSSLRYYLFAALLVTATSAIGKRGAN